jgi:hypothetical protein
MFYEQPMAERRHAPRQKSFLHGFVYCGGNPSAVDCLVRDISDSGARLKFSSGQTPAGDIVDLHIPLKGQTFRGNVRWRQADEIGVAFVSAAVVDTTRSGGAELSDRVDRLEAEMAALKKLIKHLQKNTERKTVAA